MRFEEIWPQPTTSYYQSVWIGHRKIWIQDIDNYCRFECKIPPGGAPPISNVATIRSKYKFQRCHMCWSVRLLLRFVFRLNLHRLLARPRLLISTLFKQHVFPPPLYRIVLSRKFLRSASPYQLALVSTPQSSSKKPYVFGCFQRFFPTSCWFGNGGCDE